MDMIPLSLRCQCIGSRHGNLFRLAWCQSLSAIPQWNCLHWYRWRHPDQIEHDDVIKWKHYRVTGPLCGEFGVTGESPSQRPVTRSFDVFLDLIQNKQSWGWWFETPSHLLWRHCNDTESIICWLQTRYPYSMVQWPMKVNKVTRR